jgi:hypothetical protein
LGCAELGYAELGYAECHYAECHYAECRRATTINKINPFSSGADQGAKVIVIVAFAVVTAAILDSVNGS